MSYDPNNLDGAARYLGMSERLAGTSSHRKWIEQATARVFFDNKNRPPEFVVLDSGIGFFWEAVAATSAPVFMTVVSDDDLPELIAVSYWVSADAIE